MGEVNGGADADTDAAGAAATDPTPLTTTDPILAWSLASFHTAALLAAPLLVLYAVGALGSLLQGVHTATGFALYLALWSLTLWTNRRWLAAARLDDPRAVVPGAAWGAVTGVCFLVALLVAIAVALPEPVFVAVLALVGAPVSAVVGAVAGAGFAALDLLIVAAGRRLGTA